MAAPANKLSELSTAKQSAWVDRLFERLGAMYGKHFADHWAGQSLETVKRVWREELADLSQDEVARGVSACRSRPWPPTLPEFLRLCRPALDYEAAFYEAVKQLPRRADGTDSWSTSAVYWAAQAIGSHDLLSRGYDALKGRWRAALDDAAEKVRRGELPDAVPERAEALPEPGRTSVPPEVARERVAELRAMIAPVADSGKPAEGEQCEE